MKSAFLLAAFAGLSCGLLGCQTSQSSDSSSAQATAKPATTSAAKPAPKAGMVRDSMAFPTRDVATSVLLLERESPAEIQVGRNYTYSLKLTNLTDMTLSNVAVNDVCARSFTIVDSSPKAATSTNGVLAWNVGDIEPRATRVITVTGKANQGGEITSCASVSYNPILCITSTAVQPALRLALSAPAEATPCDTIPVKAVVTNTGTGTVSNAKVNVKLPAGLTTMDGRPSTDLVVGTLAAGQSREVVINAKANAPGAYAVEAMTMADGDLTAQGTPTRTVVKQAALTLKRTAPSNQFINRNIASEITVTNSGEAVARNTVIEDTLPASAKVVSVGNGGNASVPGKVTWAIGNLEPGQSRTVSVVYAGSGAGSLSANAIAKADCANQATAGVQTNVTGIPAILIEVVDVADPIEVGTNVTYRIIVTNQGTAPGTNVKIVCTLPDSLEFVSAGGATPSAAQGATINFNALPSLAAGGKAEWTVVAKATKPGDARFRTSLSSDQFKNPIDEIESTTLYK